jgi:hypothetical protein
LVAVISISGTAYADDGGWQECAGDSIGCLFPAFQSSPQVSVSVFLGFMAGWAWPTLSATARTFAGRVLADQPLLREQESSEKAESQAVTASAELGGARVTVDEDVGDTATHVVRLVAGLWPTGLTVEEDWE